jgi:hypothetical protein
VPAVGFRLDCPVGRLANEGKTMELQDVVLLGPFCWLTAAVAEDILREAFHWMMHG